MVIVSARRQMQMSTRRQRRPPLLRRRRLGGGPVSGPDRGGRICLPPKKMGKGSGAASGQDDDRSRAQRSSSMPARQVVDVGAVQVLSVQTW